MNAKLMTCNINNIHAWNVEMFQIWKRETYML